MKPARMRSKPLMHATCRAWVGVAVAALATAPAMAQAVNDQLHVRRSRGTGFAYLVTAPNRGAIPVTPGGGRGAPTPDDFLQQYGQLFGVVDPARELRPAGVATDRLGQVHTQYEQIHRGVRVFSGVVKVHQDGGGNVLAASGEF